MAHPPVNLYGQPLPPFPPPPPPQMPGLCISGILKSGSLTVLQCGIPQAHVHNIYLPYPPPPGGPNWLPPVPPQQIVGGRLRAWRGESGIAIPRPAGEDLEASSKQCNALLRSRRPCGKPSTYHQTGYLPVCKKHKTKKSLAGRCKQIGELGRCNRLIRFHPPFAELCDDHRDWDGLPCHLLKLPVELRMQIFSYLLPDKPINAWLDAPLRQDRTRCSWELLLVNKQIRDEAMDIMYGSQPFTLALGRENVVLCGGIYAHDKSEWPSVMVYNPPRVNRTGHVPPMLKYIRHMRLQITFVNPGYPAGRPQHYPVWDESIDLFDLRDSARALAHLLSESNSLISLSVVLVAQNIFARAWTQDQLLGILKTVSEPLMQLRGIQKGGIEGVYQLHSPHRLSLTQYFPDNMRPATNNDEGYQPGDQVLAYKYSGHKHPTMIRISEGLASWGPYENWRALFGATLALKHPPCWPPDQDLTTARFNSFRKTYHSIEHNFRTVLPRGKNWMLHRARMAREANDIDGIERVRQDLEIEVKRLVQQERETIDAKEKAVMAALGEYDVEVEKDKMRKRDSGDEDAVADDLHESDGENEIARNSNGQPIPLGRVLRKRTRRF